jgi:methionine-rich copper-binding protein CopC
MQNAKCKAKVPGYRLSAIGYRLFRGDTMTRRPILWPLLGLVLLTGMLVLPAPARARAVVLRSEPSDGAVLAAAPHTLQLWFDHAAIIEPDAVSLTDSAGRALTVAGFHNEIYKPSDLGIQDLFDPTYLFLCSVGIGTYPTVLTVHLPDLAAGTYRMNWRAIAISDRKDTSGTLVFAVDPSAPPTPERAGALATSITSNAADLMVTMAIRPNRPGANFISLQAVPLRRPLRAPIEQVTLRVTPPGGTPHDVLASQTGDGTFQIPSNLIDRPGTWAAEMRIGRGIAPETHVSMTWEVPDDSAGSSLPWIAAALGGLALLGGGLLVMRRRAA